MPDDLETISRRIDGIVGDLKREPGPPLVIPPQGFDWATFGLGAIAGLLVAALGLLVGYACQCPPGWIP